MLNEIEAGMILNRTIDPQDRIALDAAAIGLLD